MKDFTQVIVIPSILLAVAFAGLYYYYVQTQGDRLAQTGPVAANVVANSATSSTKTSATSSTATTPTQKVAVAPSAQSSKNSPATPTSGGNTSAPNQQTSATGGPTWEQYLAQTLQVGLASFSFIDVSEGEAHSSLEPGDRNKLVSEIKFNWPLPDAYLTSIQFVAWKSKGEEGPWQYLDEIKLSKDGKIWATFNASNEANWVKVEGNPGAYMETLTFVLQNLKLPMEEDEDVRIKVLASAPAQLRVTGSSDPISYGIRMQVHPDGVRGTPQNANNGKYAYYTLIMPEGATNDVLLDVDNPLNHDSF